MGCLGSDSALSCLGSYRVNSPNSLGFIFRKGYLTNPFKLVNLTISTILQFSTSIPPKLVTVIGIEFPSKICRIMRSYGSHDFNYLAIWFLNFGMRSSMFMVDLTF